MVVRQPSDTDNEARKVALIVDPRQPRHVSDHAVLEAEHSFLTDPHVFPARLQGLARLSNLILTPLYKGTKRRLPASIPAPRLSRQYHCYFAVLMGPSWRKCLPFFLNGCRNSIYLFDAWPNTHQDIRRLVQQFNVSDVFVSSSQAAAQLNSYEDATTYHWIPEGIIPNQYRNLPYRSRKIDVLQLGRKYDLYHSAIADGLLREGRTYLYEKRPGDIIFPSREAFLNGLAHSKISICVPSNITHPERAGEIATMTLRYLQSMASKCLIVGHAPPEMDSLFGYESVVPVDLERPFDQLSQILASYENYLPLIERNYCTVCNAHTWNDRWRAIRTKLGI